MDKELLPQKNDVLLTPDEVNQQMTLFEDKIDLVLQKSYLQFLSESPICPLKGTYAPINWIRITKIVYEKGVFFADKMAMLYSALHHCAGSVVMVVQKIKKGPVEIFLGTRDENGFDNVSAKILEAGLKGILPGLQTDEELAPEELLETSIDGATDAIINVTGGSSLTLFEVEEAAEVIRSAANTDINTIFGAVINENLNDEVIVTVIATGFDRQGEPLYHSFNTTNREELYKDIDEEDSDFDVPPFLRDRNDY